MKPEIKEINSYTVTVNGKFVVRVRYGEWACRQELTTAEHAAFMEFIQDKKLNLENRKN